MYYQITPENLQLTLCCQTDSTDFVLSNYTRKSSIDSA